MWVGSDGYVFEWCPSHPSTHYGMVLQHRLVMECHLGRFLERKERVHHIDDDRGNNAIENLDLYGSHSEHMTAHWAGAGTRSDEWIEKIRAISADRTIPAASIGISPTSIRKICTENGIEWKRRHSGAAYDIDEQSVREALQGRTTLEAAHLLGVHVQTLYNKYDHLLKKRSSPNSLDDHKAEILHLVYKERMTHLAVSEKFGVSENCVHKTIQRWRKLDASTGEFAHLYNIRRSDLPRRKYTKRSTAQLGASLFEDPQES